MELQGKRKHECDLADLGEKPDGTSRNEKWNHLLNSVSVECVGMQRGTTPLKRNVAIFSKIAYEFALPLGICYS